jgi:integrative and conjugative element protein (TIGR02256 family)
VRCHSEGEGTNGECSPFRMKWPRLSWSNEGDKTTTRPIALVLPKAIIAAMRAESEQGLPNETGGVLVGHVDAAGCTFITAVVGPGPRALRTRTRFRRDGDYAQAEVDRLHNESAGRDDYVGEWHSHPVSAGPSGLDRDSMEWIGGNKRYLRGQPFLVIMQRTLWRSWRPLTYRWVHGSLTAVRAESGGGGI